MSKVKTRCKFKKKNEFRSKLNKKTFLLMCKIADDQYYALGNLLDRQLIVLIIIIYV